jgi:Ca2+-binding RTX toxin-like protein
MATIYGTDINDEFYGGASDYYFYGGNGDDYILSNTATGVSIEGGYGNDLISASDGHQQAYGYLFGGYGSDFLIGGLNGNIMEGGQGNDIIIGGGPMLFAVTGGALFAENPLYVSGVDNIYGGDGSDALFGLADNDYIYGGGGDDKGAVAFTTSGIGVKPSTTGGLYGGSGADYLDGGAGNDNLYGGSEVDRLLGGDGNDVLYGGTGADILMGGAGDDIYEVDNAGDFVAEVNDAQFGIADNVFAYVDYAMQWGVDNLLMNYGTQAYGIGNEINNIIIGNTSANVIEGKAGYDTLTGGAGSDTFLIRAGFGVDVITDFTAGAGTQDAIQFKTSMFANFAAVNAAASQHGADTWISATGTDVIVLSNVLKTALHADDFQFIA